MKQTENVGMSYIAPAIDVMVIKVETGFASSGDSLGHWPSLDDPDGGM